MDPSRIAPRLELANCRAAATRAEQDRVYRSTFDEAQIGVAHTSLQGRYLRVNRYLCDLLGYTPEELRAIEFAAISHPDEVAQDLDAKASLIAGAITRYTREKRHRRKDGSYVSTNLTVSLHRDAARQPAYFIVIVEDLTERKRLEQQTRQAQKMEAIGRLAGGIAHDFNNLLTAIIGYVELALAQPDGRPSSIREDLQQIRAAASSAAALTGQLLAFSRQQAVEPKVVDLNAALDRMQSLLRRLIGEHIEVKWLPARTVPHVTVDPSQLEQVVLNLALNARDAMPDGGLLTIETTKAEAGGILAISDTGIGMDPATQARLFEPFFTTKERGMGTGLGLAIVYGIVKQNGGSIFVSSEPGRGTTFKIVLPRGQSPADPPAVHAPSDDSLDGAETILLVDDQPEVRAVARTILARHGYRVLEAADGTEALSLAHGHEGRVDMLLADVVMPGISGPDLAMQLADARPDLRVLYTSGHSADTILKYSLAGGSKAYIQKPFSSKDLLRAVRSLLDPHSPARCDGTREGGL